MSDSQYEFEQALRFFLSFPAILCTTDKIFSYVVI